MFSILNLRYLHNVYSNDLQDNSIICESNNLKQTLKTYFYAKYGINLDQVSDNDKIMASKLANSLIEFKKMLANNRVQVDELDNFVHNLIESEAGYFQLLNSQKFKSYQGNSSYLILYTSVLEKFYDEFKCGRFKLDLAYNNGLRGYSNRLMKDNFRMSDVCFGASNLDGGMELITPLKFDSYSFEFSNRIYKKESNNLNLEIVEPKKKIGFVIDLNKTRIIDEHVLNLYIGLMLVNYFDELNLDKEFGFLKNAVEEYNNLKLNQSDGISCVNSLNTLFCVDGIGCFFDYKTLIEEELQKKMFGQSFFEMRFGFKMNSLGEGEIIKNETSKLADSDQLNSFFNKISKCDSYNLNLVDKLNKLGKRSHLVNETLYLLKNKALMAKLLGFDLIIKRDKTNGNFDFAILNNTNGVSICLEDV